MNSEKLLPFFQPLLLIQTELFYAKASVVSHCGNTQYLVVQRPNSPL